MISGHTYEGVSTNSSNMLLTGNRIGVGADGVTPLGNGYHGIFLSGANNVIGGAGPGEANIIAHNGTVSAFYSGVRVGNTGLGNTIRGNRIFANSQLGIDLRWPDGVNINDLGDPDTGGNNLQNYPVITFAQAYADGTTRASRARSTATPTPPSPWISTTARLPTTAATAKGNSISARPASPPTAAATPRLT